MNNLHVRQDFDLGKKNCKFGCENNVKTRRNILYRSVLRVSVFAPILAQGVSQMHVTCKLSIDIDVHWAK